MTPLYGQAPTRTTARLGANRLSSPSAGALLPFREQPRRLSNARGTYPPAVLPRFRLHVRDRLSGPLSVLARSVDVARSGAGLIGPRIAHRRPDPVPLSWLDHREPALLTELLQAVESLARRGSFTLGEEVEAFEEEFAAYCGTREAVGVSSGTEALVLGLRALGVGPGDEVVVPANSFIATAEAVSLVGAMPRFADVDADTALLTAESLEPALSVRTRCIIPVHLYGRTVDLDPILVRAEEVGARVVEDAAQAHGACYRGRRVGSFGACGCFSFYPAKNLGAWGDGGALITDDPRIADRVRLLRAHGERPRYHHRLVGTTARLDAVQAAILRVKLRRLDAWNTKRRSLAAALTSALVGTSVATPPPPGLGRDHVFHQYVVRAAERDALRAHLAEQRIETGVHYPVPIHLTPAYSPRGDRPARLPCAERLANTVCSLPVHPGLDARDIAHVASAVREFTPSYDAGGVRSGI
jgi:dTDP-3-amino-3,4,6-trideoxy-alpha-D-glucose transaminase